jgi:BCD family chlorophyll transporter-like MFS transporter
VGSTTILTAMMALGGLLAMALSARWLERGRDSIRLAALGALVGCAGFLFVIFASPLSAAYLFQTGAMLIGLGEGLFAIGTLAYAMLLPGRNQSESGIVLGAWGAVFATCEGAALLLSGAFKDWLAHLGSRGGLGEALSSPTVPYSLVYHIEILLLFGTLIALGPLVAPAGVRRSTSERFGLAEMPG